MDDIEHARASADLRRYLPLKTVTLIWFIALLGMEVYAVAATWSEWWPYPALDVTSLDDAKPGIYSFIGGSVGATLFAIRGFYWAVGPQSKDNPRYQYDPNWTWWYILRPLMGGFLGVFAYTAVRIGLATLGSTTSTSATATTTYFAVAFLAGYATTEFLEWASNVARRIFRLEGDGIDTSGGKQIHPREHKDNE